MREPRSTRCDGLRRASTWSPGRCYRGLHVLGVVVAAFIASAGSFTDDLERGALAYDSMQLDKALKSFEHAAQPPNLAASDVVAAHVWIGVTCAELGRFHDAEANFVRALEVDRT